MAPKNKEYLVHPIVSKHLLIRNIKKQFEKEIYHSPELKNTPIEQLIAQKYTRIMEGL